ncbi:HNH endonuclease signature motif containing protein [Solicola gregarius]|uniref:HNH endonuclease n=1 Tax=Solicola gregarius TaxID=2908642 RepID=A0AA46YLW9_9ACTN|nr:HNH endonuclease signature motif containing protein [Solicola gregarius]UYM06029.1 HNH endonuclease [Solicola gregarius]
MAPGRICTMRAATLTDDAESKDGLDVALDARRHLAQTEAAQYDALTAYLGQVAAEPLARAGGVNEWTRYGGSGTPSVSEYAACEVGPALGLSASGGRDLIADALDLTYRLPQLFACLHDGSVDAWRIRKVARKTRRFTIAQAADADRRLSAANVDGTPLIARVGMGRVNQILDQIRIVEDPDDPETRRNEGRNRRSVSIWPEDGVARISGTLTLDDGKRLDQRLDQIVESLRFLGDNRSYDILRSVALGMLDEPDSLDDLYRQVHKARSAGAGDDTQTDTQPDNQPDQTDQASAAGETEPKPKPPGDGERPDAFTRPRRGRGMRATTLYVHFDRTWGTWSLDDVGAITRSEAHEILGHSNVTIKPVIDLETTISATGYVAPPRLKEQLALMNASTCTFPHCTRPARVGDYDHIINHADGGETDSRNGHRLCRYHHRAKTFTAWTVQSPAPGIWLWQSPAGRSYLVTGGTTTKLPGRVTKSPQTRRKQRVA